MLLARSSGPAAWTSSPERCRACAARTRPWRVIEAYRGFWARPAAYVLLSAPKSAWIGLLRRALGPVVPDLRRQPRIVPLEVDDHLVEGNLDVDLGDAAVARARRHADRGELLLGAAHHGPGRRGVGDHSRGRGGAGIKPARLALGEGDGTDQDDQGDPGDGEPGGVVVPQADDGRQEQQRHQVHDLDQRV